MMPRYLQILLLPLLGLSLGGCSTFSQSFRNILDDTQIEAVAAQDPVARLRYKQRLARVGEQIKFDASLSASNRSLPISYRWQLLQKPDTSRAELSVDKEMATLNIDQPGRYRIRLVVNDGMFDSYPYETLISTRPTDLDRVRFIATGDTGTGSPLQYSVAAAMETVCAERGCDFAVGMGDNIYAKGPESVDDPQFQQKFEQPYQDLKMPFFMVTGNHDASGLFDGDGGFNARGGIEVEYSRKSEKWTMPARYYRFTAPLKGDNIRFKPAENSQPLVEFYALDSTPMTSLPDLLPQYRVDQYREHQGRWLDANLNNSKAQWRIAFAHHPYLSNGQHGNAGNYEGINTFKVTPKIVKLLPKMNKKLVQQVAGTYFKAFFDQHLCDRVDLYMAGHDHNMQMLKPVERCGKTAFIVSGAGAKANKLKDEQRNEVWWQKSREIGFFWIEIVADRLNATIYTVDRATGDITRAYDHTLSHSGY